MSKLSYGYIETFREMISHAENALDYADAEDVNTYSFIIQMLSEIVEDIEAGEDQKLKDLEF